MIGYRKLALIMVLCFVLIIPSAQAITQSLTIFVEADIGVNVTTDCDGAGSDTLTPEVGNSGNCLVTIKNTGNIEDELQLVAEVENEENRGWLDYHFECPGTIGECSLDYSYEETQYPPEVRNIKLSPEVSSTSVYLEAVPYRSDEQSTINLIGYSLTNRTVDELANITVQGKGQEGGYGPFAASGLSTFSLIALFLLSGLVYSVAEVR
ncbi:MAG: hypothetical protein ACLFS3_03070 [Candidatus Aenigmatarchaeota archaeon]